MRPSLSSHARSNVRLSSNRRIRTESASFLPNRNISFNGINRKQFNCNTIQSRFFSESNGDSDLNQSTHSQVFDIVSALPLKNVASGPLSDRAISVIEQPIDSQDIEIKPDGYAYLPEVKYRRILNDAFGPGGWALVPKGKYDVLDGYVVQEYALYAEGRFISSAFGDMQVVPNKPIAIAVEGAKSRALSRCCKDLGIASSLWDRKLIEEWRQEHATQVWVSHFKNGEKRKLWRRKDSPPFEFPWREQESSSNSFSSYSSSSNFNSNSKPFSSPKSQFGGSSAGAAAAAPPPRDLEQGLEDIDTMDEMDPADNTESRIPEGADPTSYPSNLQGTVPPLFKKYAGIPWEEALRNVPEMRSYWGWAINSNFGSKYTADIRDFYLNHYGVDIADYKPRPK